MARRGFFAELQYQSRLSDQRRKRAEREAVRKHLATVRDAEQTKKAEVRAQTLLAKATDAERKRLEKEARDAHLAAMEAEVLERNGKLLQVYDEIDSLLASTLEVDDYVDLNSLRAAVTHPPFDRTDLEVPIPPPKPIPDPDEPVLSLPAPPTGLARLFGKRKYAEATDSARRAREEALAEWRVECRHVLARRQMAEDAHRRAEAQRIELLRLLTITEN